MHLHIVSQVALQVGFLKHLGDIGTVLLDDDQIRSLCGALAAVRQKSHWIITINGKINIWTCKLVFPTDTLQQKIEPFFSSLKILVL